MLNSPPAISIVSRKALLTAFPETAVVFVEGVVPSPTSVFCYIMEHTSIGIACLSVSD